MENKFFMTNLDESQIKLVKKLIKIGINRSIVNLSFEKADGTVREMRGTTNFEFLPKEIQDKFLSDEKEGKVRKQNDDLCVIFDLDKNEWRSFRFDRLIDIQADITV